MKFRICTACVTLMDRSSSLKHLVFAIVGGAVIYSPVYGAVVLGNLPHAGFGGSWVAIGDHIFPDQLAAIVFTTGSSSYSVDSVMLTLSEYSTSTHIARVGVFQDNGSATNTAAQVGDFFTAPVAFSSPPVTRTFTITVPILLEADTRYWLVVENAGPGRFIWDASAPAKTPLGEGATFGSVMVSLNNGASYSSTSIRPSFQINGTAVPEPSILWCGFLGGLPCLRRRRP